MAKTIGGKFIKSPNIGDILIVARSIGLSEAIGEVIDIGGKTVKIGRIPVVSSNVMSVGYYPADSILEIEFKGNRIYQYRDVPFSEFVALMNAPSKGVYVNFFIKESYDADGPL